MNGSIYLGLFRQGMDTAQIAEKFGVCECAVYNQMHQIRQREYALQRGREAQRRCWDAKSPDQKALYYWRKKMRQAGLSSAEINKAVVTLRKESRAGPPPFRAVSGPSA